MRRLNIFLSVQNTFGVIRRNCMIEPARVPIAATLDIGGRIA